MIKCILILPFKCCWESFFMWGWFWEQTRNSTLGQRKSLTAIDMHAYFISAKGPIMLEWLLAKPTVLFFFKTRKRLLQWWITIKKFNYMLNGSLVVKHKKGPAIYELDKFWSCPPPFFGFNAQSCHFIFQ